MANKEFEELIRKRKDWVRSSKENNFDFDNILAGLYTDPSHFIYEILQNAEDEGATEVRFVLFEDRLDIYHNGEDFDLEDIDGVTGIGISKKKDDLTSIGKFGVGFKSVFAVAETPYVFSGKYKIKIEDFVIPSAASNNEQVERTLIRLPFNHKLRTQDEIFTLVSKKLEDIGLKALLFLKNIEEIRWQTPSSKGHYLKSSESFKKIPDAKRTIIISSSVTEEYIVIGKPINIEGRDLQVEVAYRLGQDKNGKEIILPEPDSRLVVFFPTEKVTFLNFVIQGPYKTTPNRENIPLEEEQNKVIIEETGNLVAKSLLVIRDLGYLDINFLSLLPINPEHKESSQIYSVIYDKVKEKFLSEELLPASDGKYTKADKALLARGKELTEFLDKNDIQELFSRQYWLDTNITYDRTRALRDYLINELGVEEVDFENFAREITSDFLQAKSDEWMTGFYSRLLDQQALWSDRGYSKGILRTKPIIRLENGEHIAPFDNNEKVQVYLPSETKSKYKTVKRALTANENSLKFLKELGLTKPDLFAEIKEFILPKYQAEKPIKDDWYFEDFEKLVTGFETISSNKKNECIEDLLSAAFIDSVNNISGEDRLCKPSEAYLPDEDLKNYFEDYQVYFVSDMLYEKIGKERMNSFLKELGVEDKPRRIKIEKVADLSWEEKVRFVGYTGRDVSQKDYEYEGLDNFIRQLTLNKSYLLWKLLLKNIENLNTWDAEEFFKGKYEWFYQTQNYKSFESTFVETLRQQTWLVDKNNNFIRASDISFSGLSDNYSKESPNIDILIKTLRFKPEIIDQLPEDYRKKLEMVKDITLEELEKLISERKKETPVKKEGMWIPEYEPDKIKPKIIDKKIDVIVTPDLTRQGEKIDTREGGETTKDDDKSKEKTASKTPQYKKAVGRWGETFVYYFLKEKYQKFGTVSEIDTGFKVYNTNNEEIEVIWLNKNSDKGIGYDFVVKKDGTEIEYIEVKAKTQEDEELIEVTGTQWEFARRLFEQNEGEKYSFYVVLNAGKENAEIFIRKNPIKLWKEGKLYAHPVNFKL